MNFKINYRKFISNAIDANFLKISQGLYFSAEHHGADVLILSI